MNQYYLEGFKASGFDANPYPKGSSANHKWIDGFVEQAIKNRIMPDSIDLYVEGRISYGLGKKITDMPENEKLEGRWVSGWLAQRDQDQKDLN